MAGIFFYINVYCFSFICKQPRVIKELGNLDIGHNDVEEDEDDKTVRLCKLLKYPNALNEIYSKKKNPMHTIRLARKFKPMIKMHQVQ